MRRRQSGMLGIPLFLLLFGPGQVYRMAALNMAQGFIDAQQQGGSNGQDDFQSAEKRVHSDQLRY